MGETVNISGSVLGSKLQGINKEVVMLQDIQRVSASREARNRSSISRLLSKSEAHYHFQDIQSSRSTKQL